MAFELQIDAEILKSIVARLTQARLRAACLAPSGAVFVDHLDIGKGPVALAQAGMAVRIDVPVDVFTVMRNDVVAAPNGVPKGAGGPPSQVAVTLELAAKGTVVSLTVVGTTPALPGPLAGGLGPPVSVDLAGPFAALQLPTPASARIQLVGGQLVAIRFDPVGRAAGHLFPGQQWGFFIDGPTVEQMFVNRIRQRVMAATSRVTTLDLEGHWRPAGGVPHVDIDYDAKVTVPDPFSGEVEGTVGIDITMTPTVEKALHFGIGYSLGINLGGGVPFFLEDDIEEGIEALFDAILGGNAEQQVIPDAALPEVLFGGARLRYASVVGVAAGMTLGGPVQLPSAPNFAVVQLSVRPFTLPLRLYFCSQSGDGKAPATIPVEEIRFTAGAGLSDCGAYCSAEIVSGPAFLELALAQPGAGQAGEDQSLGFDLAAGLAAGIKAPVQLIVRTARGVRLVDLGIPPKLELDANGDVTNANIQKIWDCLYFTQDSLWWILKWGNGRIPKDVIDPHPDWSQWLAAIRGLDMQLVTLSGLEPGELIRFRSAHHAIDVTADRRGRAIVPALLPFSDSVEDAVLARVSRGRFDGRVGVRALALSRAATLPAGRGHRLSQSRDGALAIAVDHGDEIRSYDLGRSGIPLLASRAPAPGRTEERLADVSGDEVALNPQPLPPREAPFDWRDSGLVRRLGIPGVDTIIPVPGFADAPVAFARSLDGDEHLLLHRQGRGGVRVAGTIRGPIGVIATAGGWGIGEACGRLCLFREQRS